MLVDLGEVLPDRLRPGWAWWLMALLAVGVGGYAMTLQDARSVQDAVPGMPWLDEVHIAVGGFALALGPLAFRRDLLARATAWHRRIGWLYVLGVQLAPLANAFGSFETGYRIVSWSCWVPNLLFAWWWLRRTDATGRARGRGRPRATTG